MKVEAQSVIRVQENKNKNPSLVSNIFCRTLKLILKVICLKRNSGKTIYSEIFHHVNQPSYPRYGYMCSSIHTYLFSVLPIKHPPQNSKQKNEKQNKNYNARIDTFKYVLFHGDEIPFYYMIYDIITRE